jgi:peptidoglycan/xylan/chitin deacetylase (PgdA/CDA1 family)
MFALTRRLRLHRDVEAYGLSALYQVLVACHLAVFLRWWAAILLAPFVIQLPMYAMGLFVMPRWRNNLTVNSRVLMALMIGVSLWLRTWPAYAFLALVAANALAAFLWRTGTLACPPSAVDEGQARVPVLHRAAIIWFAALAPLALFYGWRVGVAVIVLSHLLIVYATLVPNCQWLGPVITCFETDAKEVWLTIDDGPASDTDAIKDMLARRDVPATFFEIGVNHSKTHPSATFWCLGPRRLGEEIGESRWFRAPVGMKNPFVHPILAKRGMRLIGWTVRGLDTTDRGAERVVNRILRGVRPGAIVVLHQGRPHSLRTIEAVVEALQARGYVFVIPHDARLKTKR